MDVKTLTSPSCSGNTYYSGALRLLLISTLYTCGALYAQSAGGGMCVITKPGDLTSDHSKLYLARAGQAEGDRVRHGRAAAHVRGRD